MTMCATTFGRSSSWSGNCGLLSIASVPTSPGSLSWLVPMWISFTSTPAGGGGGLARNSLEQAKRLRPNGLWLWTFQANTGARRFYERHGFVAVDATDGSGNEERAPDVRYAWRP
jgi:hypothetical protein